MGNDQPSELRRRSERLDFIVGEYMMSKGSHRPGPTIDTVLVEMWNVQREIVTRLDALAGAGKGEARAHTFTKGQMVRIARNSDASWNDGDIGREGLVSLSEAGHVRIDFGDGEYGDCDAADCELVADDPDAKSPLVALLDELTPSWREETSDPLAAVRGIAEQKDAAFASSNAAAVELGKTLRERDEARAASAAKDAEIAALRKERDRLSDDYQTAKGLYVAAQARAELAERERDEARAKLAEEERESERHHAALYEVSRLLDIDPNSTNEATIDAARAMSAKLAEAVKERDEAKADVIRLTNESAEAMNARDEWRAKYGDMRNESIIAARKLTASETARASAEAERDGERAHADEAVKRIRELRDAPGFAYFRTGVQEDVKAIILAHDSRRRPATEGAKAADAGDDLWRWNPPPTSATPGQGNEVPPVRLLSKEEMKTMDAPFPPEPIDPPTPAAGDLDERSESLGAEIATYSRGGLVAFARRALTAEDDVRRLREALERIVEASPYVSLNIARAALSAEPRK